LRRIPRGLVDIQQTVQWRDALARWSQSARESEDVEIDAVKPPKEAVQKILPDVLRRLHAQQAAVLAEQAWLSNNGEQLYLINDSDVRFFYGKTIGDIAHSHWWSVQRVYEELFQDLGAFPQRTRNLVDRVKIACLLRIADALHLDQLRAPRFLRALTRPQGVSALHWSFQERLARPHIESDAVVFTSGRPFERSDAEAWWLAYDSLSLVDRELRDVDLVLQARGRQVLRARRIKGVGSPEALSKMVTTRDWRPVDARVQVSDVPRIVESLGGSKLYGDDPLVPVRELIQNATDAVQARRRFQGRPASWGEIRVSIASRDDGSWLVVEDNGIGMSEQVLTGPLLDFGTSFWQSSLAMEEFPGLAAAGMRPIGRFGIGFFSVFMLGDIVRVISRRCDRGQETARVLEIRGGPAGRPILWPAKSNEAPLDGGTRVEVCLRDDPRKEHGILWAGRYVDKPFLLDRVVASVAPSLDVELACTETDAVRVIVAASDWVNIAEPKLLARLDPAAKETEKPTTLRPMVDANRTIFGRVGISMNISPWWDHGSGRVTVSGLRANRLWNLDGILAGEAITAARDLALPSVPREVLSGWATEQAQLFAQARVDDETKAVAAEIVLECGGDIGLLPIVSWAGEWLNSEEFAVKAAEAGELILNFDGEFSYDEDADSMHPRDFKDGFKVADSIVMVPKHDGSIVRARGVNWPASLFERRSGKNRLSALVRKIVHDSWGGDYDESEDDRVVGKAVGESVWRSVTIFSRPRPDVIEEIN
jgi:hypothetical protein